MINKEKMEDLLTSAASEYAYECDDRDFVCMVRVSCEDGWAKATVLEHKEGGEE